MSDAPFAIVTGGGTSGHVVPALAVAEALVAGGHEPGTVHYWGCERGIETRLVPDTPFPHRFFDVVGFQRSLSWRNLAFAPKLLRARTAAIAAMRAARPAVVVTVGGYASMPAVLAARSLGVPLVVVSYDLLPGRASRLAARNAVACAVAFPGSTLPRATLTGAPVRQAVLDVDRQAGRDGARAALGLPTDRFVVAVMGGSLGSGVLNDAVARLVSERRDDRSLAIRHAVGDRFIANAPPARDGSDGLIYQPIGYEDRMPLVYAAADVLVGRGGASTVHEVAATGTPAVLVPWSGAAEDHQTLNVDWLADDGAAIRLRESEVGSLADLLAELRADPERLAAIGRRAAARGEIHRSGALAQLVESAAIA